MSKSSCRFVVTKKDDCCYKTTTETVVGLYGVAVPAFPASSTKDSVHVVRYDDALVTYAYNGTAWIETTNTPITSSVTPGVLVDNGDGTYTWTDTTTTFVIDTVDRVLSTAVYSAATQDFTFTWSNGDTTVVDLTGLLNVYSLLGGNNTVVTGNGVSIPWEVNGYGVADNSDGTFTVTLPDGVTTFLIDTNETVTNIVGNTYTNEAGTAQAIVQTVVNTVTGNNLTTTVNGVASTSVALPPDIVTTLVDNLDGTYTYTDETGAVTTFNTNDTVTTLVDNGNGTLTYTSEDGTVTTFNQGFTSVTDNGDGTWTYTYPDLSTTTLDICALLAASSCLPTLVDNTDGTYTFDDGQGNTTTFNGGWTTFANSTNGFTATYPDGSTYVWAETITSLVAATNGWEYTSEDGTATTVTYLFDNTTPSAPTLLVQVNGTTQASIPLNSYDVNIATTGGFAFNAVTDVITITETDGETHTIDLTQLRTTLTSTDSSVELVTSVNPDGSTNYDLGVKAHTNQVETVPYTGTELPSIAGVNIGDTTDAQFTDGAVVSYTWDGAAWIPDFQQTWAEQRICLNTAAVAFTPADLNNPLTTEVDAWATANLTLKQRQNGTKLVYFVAGDGGSCDVPDYVWTLNKGSQLITLSSKRNFNSEFVYVDTKSGSDVTGLRGYENYQFKSFSSALNVLQNKDIIYHNGFETISSSNIAPLLTEYSIYFKKDVDITSNVFIGSNLTAGLPLQSFKKVLLKSDKKITQTTNGSQLISHHSEVDVAINEYVTNGNIANSNLGGKIKIGTVNSKSLNPLGFIGRMSNSNVSVEVDNLIIDNPTSGFNFLGSAGGVITNGIDNSNSYYSYDIKNIRLINNTCVLFGYNTTSTAKLSFAKIFFRSENIKQESPTIGSYPLTAGSSHSILKLLDGIDPTVENTQVSLSVQNSESDISAVSFGNIGGILQDSKVIIFFNNSIVKKLPSIHAQNLVRTIINSDINISGNYINTSPHPIIYLNGTILTLNTNITFNGNFKANTNISLAGLTIDTTSKIVFKGRYELGDGYFDISGVTGAGADNVYFEDCTIVTNNTECIVSGTAKNVKILDVRSNKPTSANVTELVSSIIVNSVIN